MTERNTEHLSAKPVNAMLAEIDALRDLERVAANALIHLQALAISWPASSMGRRAVTHVHDEITTCLARVNQIRRPGARERDQ